MKLCLLLLAHFVADFMLQSTEMAHMKIKNRNVFLKHCLIYSAVMFMAVMLYGTIVQAVLIAAFISLSHLIVDHLRIRSEKRHIYTHKREFRRFILDQATHLVIIIIVVFYIPDKNYIGQGMSDIYYTYFTPKLFAVAVILTAYAACLQPAGVFIKKMFLRLEFQQQDIVEENMAGFLIGILERVCILTLAILSQYTAISFVIAAKSLARIKLLEDKNFAEKYLVGTLVSVVIALISGVMVQKLIRI